MLLTFIFAKNYIVMGHPGAGKGTFGQHLKQHRGYQHFSMGDILRDAVKRKDPLGVRYKKQILAGKMIPEKDSQTILEHKLKTAKKFVLDGFPRTLGQLAFLLDFIRKTGGEYKFVLISADCAKRKQRILNRFCCSDCETVYNQVSKPPKIPGVCDICSKTLTQRESDKDPKMVDKRLREYQKLIDPVIKGLHAAQIKVSRMDGNKDLEQIYAEYEKL